MSSIISSNIIEFWKTKKSDIKLVMAMEKDKTNASFIFPYAYKQHLEVINNKDCLHLTIRLKDSGEMVGFVILAGAKNKNKSVEFRRIVISKKRMGFGRTSVKLIKKLCFEKLKCHRLWLDVFGDNERATNLYRSEGFVQEGKMRECVKQGKNYRSLLLYSLLLPEYLRK